MTITHEEYKKLKIGDIVDIGFKNICSNEIKIEKAVIELNYESGLIYQFATSKYWKSSIITEENIYHVTGKNLCHECIVSPVCKKISNILHDCLTNKG